MFTDIRTLGMCFLFGFVVSVALRCKCVGAGAVDCVSLIAFLCFVLSESVICLLTSER